MKIYLHEITDQETELDYTQNEKWVLDSVARVDETLDEPSALTERRKPRPVRAHFSLRKVDDVIVVSGDIETHIRMVCSRCASSFELPTHPSFSALFCKDPVMAGVAHLQGGKPGGQSKGFARHAHDSEADLLSDQGKDLDITYLSQDFIDLGDVLTEQLRLQIPFQPLCRETCKGMCAQCGADLNAGRCACAKLASSNPFLVLKDLKL